MTDPRTLVRSVLQPGFTIAGALAEADPQAIVTAIASCEAVKPLMEVEPGLDGPESLAVADLLRPIGAKIAPTMSGEQASAWRKAMLLALSDLPPRVARRATEQAIHKPMEFISQAETAIREIAEEMIRRHDLALSRLRMMRAEIERAASGQKQITDRASDPITVAEAAGWTPEYRRIGVECGFITKEMAEAAEALIAERNAALDRQA